MPVSTLEICLWGVSWSECMFLQKRFLFNLMPGILVILTMNECWCLVGFLKSYIFSIFKMNALLNASYKQSGIICLLILQEDFMVRSSHQKYLFFLQKNCFGEFSALRFKKIRAYLKDPPSCNFTQKYPFSQVFFKCFDNKAEKSKLLYSI